MPERRRGFEDFFGGFAQAYSSEQDRQRQVLQAQLQQAAQERQTALALAQAGITDPSVFEAFRPAAAPPPGPGTPGATIVDLLGRLGGRLPGKAGEVAGRLKSPTYAADEPGISADEYAKVAGAFGEARKVKSAEHLKQVIADATARERIKQKMDPKAAATRAVLEKLFPNASGGMQAQAPATAPAATPSAAAPKPEGKQPEGKATADPWVAGFPDDQVAQIQAVTGMRLPSQSDVAKRGYEADQRQIARQKQALADAVFQAKLRLETGQAKQGDEALIRVASAEYKTPEEREETESAKDERLLKTLSTQIGRSKPNMATIDRALRVTLLQRYVAQANKMNILFPEPFPVSDPWGPGKFTTADPQGIAVLFGIADPTFMGGLEPPKGQTLDASFKALEKYGRSGALNRKQVAEIGYLLEGGGNTAARTDKLLNALGAPATATAEPEPKQAKPSREERIRQLKGQGVSRAEGLRILQQEGYK